MSKAALPTDFIVIAENKNGKTAPINKLVYTSGSNRLIVIGSPSSVEAAVIKAANNAKEVKIAAPIANPFNFLEY